MMNASEVIRADPQLQWVHGLPRLDRSPRPERASQIVGAGRVRLAAVLQAVHPGPLYRDDALLDIVPGPRRPREKGRRDVLDTGAAPARHRQPIPLLEADRALAAVDLDDGLGEGLDGKPGRIAAIHDRRRAALVVHH